MFDALKNLLSQPIVMNFDTFGMIITGLLIAFWFLFYRAQKYKGLDWTDLITAKGTNKISLTKLLQLVGGVVGTWMMVIMTLKSTMSVDYFMTYLTYVGAIDGWSKFVSAKYSLPAQNTQEIRTVTESTTKTRVDPDPGSSDSSTDEEKAGNAALERAERG